MLQGGLAASAAFASRFWGFESDVFASAMGTRFPEHLELADLSCAERRSELWSNGG